MKIGGIGANVPRRLATLMLGTGLMFSTTLGARAQEVKNDAFQKEDTELIDENANKNKIKGGLAFGGVILAYLGCLWFGNKMHNRIPNNCLFFSDKEHDRIPNE